MSSPDSTADESLRTPAGLPAAAEAYWRSLYERERMRAEEAEARFEELRSKEVASRARAGSLKWHLDNCRKKLAARVEEVKEAARLRRVVEKRAKTIESLREELEGREKDVARLENRLTWEKLETADHRKTIQYRDEELIRLYGKLRESRDELRVSLRDAGRVAADRLRTRHRSAPHPGARDPR